MSDGPERTDGFSLSADELRERILADGGSIDEEMFTASPAMALSNHLMRAQRETEFLAARSNDECGFVGGCDLMADIVMRDENGFLGCCAGHYIGMVRGVPITVI